METITSTAYDPEYNRVDKEELEKYLKKHPFPKDNKYSVEYLKNDLLNSSGVYRLKHGVKMETIAYIEDLLNELVK